MNLSTLWYRVNIDVLSYLTFVVTKIEYETLLGKDCCVTQAVRFLIVQCTLHENRRRIRKYGANKSCCDTWPFVSLLLGLTFDRQKAALIANTRESSL